MNLTAISKASLEANIVTLPSGRYLSAGRRQFASLWTRDFCLASRGLLLLGHHDVVRNHLDALLGSMRQDGLICRSLDSIATQRRVVQVLASRTLGGLLPNPPPLRDPLHAEFVNENKTDSIDSNSLTLITAAAYVKKSGDQEWWNRNRPELVAIYRYYDGKISDGTITQPAYSDWQDSSRREGKTFYANLLYWKAMRSVMHDAEFGVTEAAASDLQKKIHSTFFDQQSGLYRSLSEGPWVSVDGNLLALDWDFAPAALYASLKKSALWNAGAAGIPGFVTTPDYPKEMISWTTKAAGLRHYHDQLYWGWLIGLSLKQARRFGDKESTDKIQATLERIAARDGGIGEVYVNSPELSLWRSLGLRSEIPFSWGAAFVLDATASL